MSMEEVKNLIMEIVKKGEYDLPRADFDENKALSLRKVLEVIVKKYRDYMDCEEDDITTDPSEPTYTSNAVDTFNAEELLEDCLGVEEKVVKFPTLWFGKRVTFVTEIYGDGIVMRDTAMVIVPLTVCFWEPPWPQPGWKDDVVAVNTNMEIVYTVSRYTNAKKFIFSEFDYEGS